MTELGLHASDRRREIEGLINTEMITLINGSCHAGLKVAGLWWLAAAGQQVQAAGNIVVRRVYPCIY